MTDDSRLADILERVDRILRAIEGGRSAFLDSEVIQDAVVRNLEVIGDAAKSVSSTTRKGRIQVPRRAMARFRDLAILHYGRVLSEEVREIVVNDLPRIRRVISRSSV